MSKELTHPKSALQEEEEALSIEEPVKISEKDIADDERRLRVSTRRQLVWKADRRGMTVADIVSVLKAKNLLEGVKAPYFMVRRDVIIGRKVARTLRNLGDVVEAEAIYLGRLEEMYAMAMGEKDFNIARQILHDWAWAHGIRIEEPMSPITNGVQVNLNQIIAVGGNGDGIAREEALRNELRRIGGEVTRLVGSSGLDQSPSGEDEPN